MKLTCLAHTGAALACLLTLAACSPAETMTSTPGPSASEDEVQTGVLSAFSTTDLEGNTLDQSILADYDLTMVNVWATFCGPCINEMPDLGELAAEYADKGVQIIGLVSDTMDSDGTISDSQVETAKEIVAETGADYRHLLPSDDLLGILSQIYAVPTTFFVDSEGVQVGDAIVTAQSKKKWIETIDGMLAEVQA
ncbi:MAG: TlpA family protein disulfide reductase [Clostridiaceae bacterium]|nr:TlpA family protein disulfide reductase [Clostridiaceae bacterium]